MSPEGKDEKDVGETRHLERTGSGHGDDKVDHLTADSEAAQVIAAEKAQSYKEVWRTHKKGLLWSMGVSWIIVMESYNTMLVSTFFAYPSFKERFGVQLANGTYQLEASWQLALGLSPTIGIIIGILMNGYLIDRFGHRMVCLVSLFIMCGLFVMTFEATGLPMLFASQILLGVPQGCLNTAAPSYAVESVPTKFRHFATAFVNMCWVIGHIIGAGILNGTLPLVGDWGWKLPFVLQYIWPLPLAVILIFAPDSPWWLMRHNRRAEAIHALNRLSSPGVDNEAVATTIAHTIEMERQIDRSSSYLACFKGTNLRRTEIALIVWVSQNLVGFAMQANQIYFFTLAGLPASDSFKLGLGTYAIAGTATLTSMYLMTYIGRRTIMLYGYLFMFVMMFTIGIIGCVPETSATRWASASLLLIWFLGYGFSCGPVPYVLASEVGSAQLRQKTISIARSTYYVTLIINSIVAPYMLNPQKGNLKGKAAFPAAGFLIACMVWAYFRLPETKDRSFQELDILFSKRVPARRFKGYQISDEDHQLGH